MNPSLTVFEKADLALRLPFLFLPQVLLNCLRCASLAWWRGLPIRLYVSCGIIRTFLGCFSPRQIQVISPTPLETYKQWTAKKAAAARKSDDSLALSRLKVDIEELPDGQSSLLWIGNRQNASQYVLFFPGGGYIAPLTSGHLEWCFRSYVSTRKGDPEVAVAVLQYTLCPAARHPTQLSQASAALRSMIDSGIRAGSIIVGGDSAGGNLTAQLLGHLAHGAIPFSLSEPLAGAFLVSPWVSRFTNTRSFLDNEYIDMLSSNHARASARNFLAQPIDEQTSIDKGQERSMPLDGGGEWLDNWGKVTKALYVAVGANEVLRDQGFQIAEIARTRNKDMDVRLEVAETDAHDFVLLEGMMAFAAREYSDTPVSRLACHRSVVMSFFKELS
ncbi:putative Alpha/Beta hydrolase protein [Seiridium unicorne]|uniref:Alpha/Beta hydrolase protein n=1 Tax=Seiridium unicorne TaxID=138068 RepID=A0ABR2VDM7_9PEZI